MPDAIKMQNAPQSLNKAQNVPMERIPSTTYSEELTKKFSTSPLEDYTKIYKKEPDITDSVKDVIGVIRVTKLSSSYINNLIKKEGFENEEYKDAAGIRTVGVGHNIEEDIYMCKQKNIRLSNEEVYQTLAKDLIVAQNKLKSCTNDKQFTPQQNEALVDIFFNVKTETIEKSNFLKFLKSGDYKKAVQEMDFVLAGKRVAPGLCIRRIENINTFCGGKHTIGSINAMKKIIEKGLKSFDKTFFLNPKVMWQKHNYIDESMKLLKNAEKNKTKD